MRKAYYNCIRIQTKENRVYYFNLRYYADDKFDNPHKKLNRLFQHLTQLTPNANKNMSQTDGSLIVPYIGMK